MGFAELQTLPGQFEWFTQAMIVNPVQVFPFVFHGWLLFFVFLVSAATGFGLEYVFDREAAGVARV